MSLVLNTRTSHEQCINTCLNRARWDDDDSESEFKFAKGDLRGPEFGYGYEWAAEEEYGRA